MGLLITFTPPKNPLNQVFGWFSALLLHYIYVIVLGLAVRQIAYSNQSVSGTRLLYQSIYRWLYHKNTIFIKPVKSKYAKVNLTMATTINRGQALLSIIAYIVCLMHVLTCSKRSFNASLQRRIVAWLGTVGAFSRRMHDARIHITGPISQRQRMYKREVIEKPNKDFVRVISWNI